MVAALNFSGATFYACEAGSRRLPGRRPVSKRFLGVLLLAAAQASGPLQAEEIEAGLWEISSDSMQLNGQALPDMRQMMQILQQLPAEQRQQMLGAMRRHGVEIGGEGVRVCLSQAQVEAQELPLQAPASGCRQEILERSGQSWRFRFSCPQVEGEGETEFLGPREFVTRITSRFDSQGMPQDGRMVSRARWLKADCGRLGPAQ